MGMVVGADAALLAVAAVQFLAQPFQPPDRLGLQPAIGQFLDAVGQPALQVAAVERRRLAVEQVAPLRLQVRVVGVVFSAARRAGMGSGLSCGSPVSWSCMTALVGRIV
jgi:hypothetical protein